jgi:hypothetical protein
MNRRKKSAVDFSISGFFISHKIKTYLSEIRVDMSQHPAIVTAARRKRST